MSWECFSTKTSLLLFKIIPDSIWKEPFGTMYEPVVWVGLSVEILGIVSFCAKVENGNSITNKE